MGAITAVVAIWLTVNLSAAHATAAAPVEEILPGCKSMVAVSEGKSASRDPLLSFMSGRCYGIIEGVLGAGYAIDVCLPVGPTIPEGPPIHQIMRVIINFIEAHPAKMHEGFMALAAQALRGAWRCKPGETM